ncbi:MAG: glycoside hydrolase family 125 protein [Actinobacteria bacterium]|nr:glycoside hydrolase family 125 protein [Actinomycetota bacterium]
MSLEIPSAIAKAVEQLPAPLAKYAPWLTASVERLFRNAAKETENGIYLSTGDIPAMWLRDSSFQIRPLIRFSQDPEVFEFCSKVIRQQAFYIQIDPYANAFNPEPNGFCWHKDFEDQSPWVFERKWEIDSLASFLDVSARLAEISGRTEHLDASWHEAARVCVDIFSKEQNHKGGSYVFIRQGNPAHDYLSNNGLGAEYFPCGLIWSAFRPSDDACELPFHIPQNAYASASLKAIAKYLNPELEIRAHQLSTEIAKAIEKQALTEKGYAYEVDGFGNHLFMDDANIPSLLSLPYLGFCDLENTDYQKTREFALSKNNPWFFEGSKLNHIGSPHTGLNKVWPLAMAMELLASVEVDLGKLEVLIETAPDHAFHESVDVDNPQLFTRQWFSWADMTFFDAVFRALELQKK